MTRKWRLISWLIYSVVAAILLHIAFDTSVALSLSIIVGFFAGMFNEIIQHLIKISKSMGNDIEDDFEVEEPKKDPFRGSLTEEEWRELVALEYVLTWGYSDDKEKDEKRHRELINKRDESLK